MEVYFDYELDENSPLRGTKNFIDEELRSFLKSRYKVLDDELERCRKQGEQIFVVVDWKPHGIFLQNVNAPEHLLPKLKACFTQDDSDYFMEKMWSTIKNILKE